MAASAAAPMAPVCIALLVVLLLLPLLVALLLLLPLPLPLLVVLLLLLPVIVTGLTVIPPSLQLLMNAKRVQFNSRSVGHWHTSRPTIHETLCIGGVQTTVFGRNTTVKTRSKLLTYSRRADTGEIGAGLRICPAWSQWRGGE